MQSGRFGGFAGGEPGLEGGFREDAEDGVHAVMAEAADLGAEDGVGAGDLRGEVDVVVEAGDGVLLYPHLRDGEAMDDVLGAQGEIDLTTGRQDQLTADQVVAAVGIVRVETEGIAGTGIGEGKRGVAEGAVVAGIAEVPDELHARDLNLHGGGAGAGVTLLGPQLLGTEAQPGEEDSEERKGDVFKGEFVDRARGAAAKGKASEEQNVHEREEGEGDPEIQEQVCVKRGAVARGVGRQMPEAEARGWLRCGEHSFIVGRLYCRVPW